MMAAWIWTAFLGYFAWEDFRKKSVPLKGICIAAGCGILLCALWQARTPAHVFLALLPGGALLLASLLTREKIGAGDGLVFAAGGLYLPCADTLELMCLSFFAAAGVAGLLLLKRKKKGEAFAFLPCVFFAQTARMILMAAGGAA